MQFMQKSATNFRPSFQGLSVKTLAVLAALTLLPACASLSGRDKAPPVGVAEVEAARMQTAALEVEVARLKSENARLANQLLDIRRQQARQEVAANDAGPEDAAENDGAPPTSSIRNMSVPDPQPLANAVVDTADDPGLAETDVPVETAPRLVQPTFASNENVFENEADSEIQTASVLFGVHLASYRAQEEAREGWRKLQRDNPDELGLLEPRVESVSIEGKGVFLRLIGGGFSSEERAQALCGVLSGKGQFCSVVGFGGQRLSLAEIGR